MRVCVVRELVLLLVLVMVCERRYVVVVRLVVRMLLTTIRTGTGPRPDRHRRSHVRVDRREGRLRVDSRGGRLHRDRRHRSYTHTRTRSCTHPVRDGLDAHRERHLHTVLRRRRQLVVLLRTPTFVFDDRGARGYDRYRCWLSPVLRARR